MSGTLNGPSPTDTMPIFIADQPRAMFITLKCHHAPASSLMEFFTATILKKAHKPGKVGIIAAIQ
jgi:hypothetical protein